MASRQPKKTPFLPWTTNTANGIEKRYIRLGNSLLSHNSTIGLGDKAFRIYVDMLLESGGQREFEYPYSKYCKLVSPRGFQKVMVELEAAGFIEVAEHNKTRRLPNKYRFSEKWRTHSNN